jgi:hypothetical protein
VIGKTRLLERLAAPDLFLLLMWDDYGWSPAARDHDV